MPILPYFCSIKNILVSTKSYFLKSKIIFFSITESKIFFKIIILPKLAELKLR